MKIRYTRHAEKEKFAIFSRHGFVVNKRMVRRVIEYPDHEEYREGGIQVIASKQIDTRHVLRVVYRREDDIIVVITFYPAEIGRYYL